MVFVCADTGDYARQRIVLKYNWLEHFHLLGATLGGDWSEVRGKTPAEFRGLLRETLFVGDHGDQTRFEAHAPVANLLRDRIIAKYYRDTFTRRIFPITPIRNIFRQNNPDTSRQLFTSTAAQLFTTTQLDEIIHKLLLQSYLVRTETAVAGTFDWVFTNVVAGDVIGIPVQYRDNAYMTDTTRTTLEAAGAFTLCVEHDPTLTGYVCEFQSCEDEAALAVLRTDAGNGLTTAAALLGQIVADLAITTAARDSTVLLQTHEVFDNSPPATDEYKAAVDQAATEANRNLSTVTVSLDAATAANAVLSGLESSIRDASDLDKATSDLQLLRVELGKIHGAQAAATAAKDLADAALLDAAAAVAGAIAALPVLSPTYTRNSAAAARWTPIGTIAGTQYCDRTGTIVCVSDDGKTIASRGGGPIRVYRYQQATGWGQLGPDVPSDSHGNNTISLSADGNILAIGMQWWDATYVTNGSGKVTIVQYTDGAWSVIGEIKGWDDIRTGCSVSLSADGHTVAMGAYMHKADGYKSGHVRIHRYDATTGTTWPRLGDIIPGIQYDEAGRTGLSLSADGTTVTVTTRVTGEQADEGQVRIFKYGDGVWDQMGEGIPGEMDQDGPRQTSLSPDGTVVAIGAYKNDGAAGRDSGHVRVYKFHPDRTTKWRQIGGDIDGEAKGDASGASVSLSADGTMLAIGAPANDASSGHIRIFKNIGNEWVQVGPDIDGVASGDRAGSSVSLTADGTTVAVGECNYSTDLTQYVGRIRVFTTDEVPIPTFTRTTTTSGPGGVPLYTDGPQYTVQSGLPSNYYYRFYGNGNSKIGLVLKSLSDAGTATSADVYEISKADWNDPAKFPDGPRDA
jgi:hypothetical protein